MVPSYAFSKALCQHYLLLLLIFNYSFDYNIKKNKTIWNYNFLFPHPQCLPPVLPLVKFLYGLLDLLQFKLKHKVLEMKAINIVDKSFKQQRESMTQ